MRETFIFDAMSAKYPQLSNESLKAATDGCFVAYHSKSSSTIQQAVSYWEWPAIAKQGEIADGVLVLIDGRSPIIVSITNGPSIIPWSKNDIEGNSNLIKDYDKVFNDYEGKVNTDLIIAHGEELFGDEEATWKDNYATPWCRDYQQGALLQGTWNLPSVGELMEIWKHKNAINKCLSVISEAQLIEDSWYWTSTEYSNLNAWCLNVKTGSLRYYNKSTTNLFVRAVTSFH